MESAPAFSGHRSPENKHEVAELNHSYEILYEPERRAEYLRLTDELVYRLVEQKTDVAIFLDRSICRTVAWMVDKLWDSLAPAADSDGQPTKKPDIKFLNIDREQWGAILGRSEDKVGGINVGKLPLERVEELRALYAPVKGHSAEGDQSLLTDKSVMVIDEVRQSGDTLEMSEKILRKVFPDAEKIKGAYWMHGGSVRDPRSGAKVGTEVPVWYSDRVVTGRLVGNRDTNKSSQSNSYRQRVGQYWLSTPFKETDTRGLQLKQEVKWMAEDLRQGNLAYIPSLLWAGSKSDPIEDRIERLNGIGFEEYIRLRQEARTPEDLVRMIGEYRQAKLEL